MKQICKLIFTALKCYELFMENLLCSTCRGPKATFKCGICESLVCKVCVQFIDEHAVSFLSEVPPELSHSSYCGECYAEKVEPQMLAFRDTIEKAEQVTVFFKNQGKRTRLMRRAVKPFHVKNCTDKRETIMRLAFLAAKANFNTIIDVDVNFKKVYTHSYQTSIWEGSAVPINLSVGQLKRE